MASLDYDRAAGLLAELSAEAEIAFQQNQPPPVEQVIGQAADVLFKSSTQSYLEVLLGCGLARLIDGSINIRHRYMEALMLYMEALEGADEQEARELVLHLLYRFVEMREAATIPLSKD